MVRLHHGEGLTAVAGIRAAGVAAGLKRDRPDVALIVSDRPSTAAAVFTRNAFAAAPVHLSRQHVADGDIRAIVCNSANANACTGRNGLRDALAMARQTAKLLDIEPTQVLVSSTGIIGQPLPIDKVLAGIEAAAGRLDLGTGAEVAQAIMTTDCGPKESERALQVGELNLRVAGVGKGAGMIHPDMATMLAFLVTDAALSAADARQLLRNAVDATFNQISVDGDESTNDMAAILATGAAGKVTPEDAAWEPLQRAITEVCEELARKIAADGEGATCLITVEVEEAIDQARARRIARAVSSSNLVKTAMFGRDPNWGRIVAAMGQEDRELDPTRVRIDLGRPGHLSRVLEAGEPRAAEPDLRGAEIVIRIGCGLGPARAVAWGSDLTNDYVTFNSAYTT